MLADQARYDEEEESSNEGGFAGSGDVVLTEDNADQFINYINSINRGQ
jgi:hypothetical protein